MHTEYSYIDIFTRLVPDYPIELLEYWEDEEIIAYVELFFSCLGSNKSKGADKEPSKPFTDYVQDYPYIWDSFKAKRNIDLNTDDINWWQFQTIFEAIILEGDGSYGKVLEYRTYKKPPKKGGEKRHHELMMKMKSLFSLKVDENLRKQIVNNGINKMFMWAEAEAERRNKH